MQSLGFFPSLVTFDRLSSSVCFSDVSMERQSSPNAIAHAHQERDSLQLFYVAVTACN